MNFDEETKRILDTLAWISPQWEQQDELIRAWGMIQFVNDNNMTTMLGRAGIIVSGRTIYLPDSAIYAIKESDGVKTPLKLLWNAVDYTEGERVYDLSEFNEMDVLIVLIALTSNHPDALKFVMPEYSPGILRFAQMFLPSLENIIGVTIGRVLDAAVLKHSTVASIAVIKLACEVEGLDKKYGTDVSIGEALKYVVWLHPQTALDTLPQDEQHLARINDIMQEHIGKKLVCCHGKIDKHWSDIHATWVLINNMPDVLPELQELRASSD